jgi:glucose/arabinose dehydrogenase
VVRPLLVGAALVACAAATALGTEAPLLPVAANGAPVSVLARGVPTPTAIAAYRGATLVGGAGTETTPRTPGGIFALRGGTVVRVPGSPSNVAGLAVRGGTLYATAGSRILAWRAWNGRRLGRERVVYRAPRGFSGFNGLAVGPDGRLYVGVAMPRSGDHARARGPYGNSLLSLRPDGRDVRVVARGLRQPWQVAFAGRRGPFVTALGQDNLGRRKPPDAVVLARSGQDYGFPRCNWTSARSCAGAARPFALLPAHSSPMGIAAIGGRVYVALFSGLRGTPEVVALPVGGGSPTPVITRFSSPVIALAAIGGRIYVGDAGGAVYSVAAAPGRRVRRS